MAWPCHHHDSVETVVRKGSQIETNFLVPRYERGILVLETGRPCAIMLARAGPHKQLFCGACDAHAWHLYP